MTALAGRLSAAEVDFLAQCEDTIEAGLHTFVEVGTALAAVRDNRLYRADHKTFEDYCAARWQISRAHAYRLVAAAEAVSPIGDTGLPLPTNEGQARELARVPEEQRAEVWAETVARTEGKPTAAAVRETAASKISGPTGAADHTPPADPDETPARQGLAPLRLPESEVIPDGEPDQLEEVAQLGETDSATSSAEPPAGPSAVAVHSDRPGLAEQTELARWQAGFLAQVHAVHKVLRYPVADVVAMADDECLSELRRVVQLATRYLDDIDTLARAELPANVTPIRRAQ